MMHDVTIPAAALAGLLSFLSPCVLPLVPPYLTFIAGTTIEEAAAYKEVRARRAILLAAVLFVFGFSTVFVGLGATASSFGQLLHEYFARLSVLAGGAIILMGLHFLGVFRFAFLYREARVDVQRPAGIWGAYVMGLAFGFGWTPCIGPILAAILAVAASQETVGKGVVLLTAYSAGLGVPFLLAALAFEPFLRAIKRCRPYFGAIERVIGVLLVVTGIAFLTGSIQDASAWLLQNFPGLANLG
ncbi:MAG: cytochrome c biogenesis protein CcdA [Beijerinckiaceae bacterium]|nr:cytochrome c biogenesis protein CcdA [Beijerinckiaceae bacterium]MCI0601147.1 cytochrome c biogenesis protein CcdA [Beijerinckiaceae bacterium]MCI0735261.1 cytochrome c biogenesis protein CcdA [Beijerinckiaceae bacterium]